MYDSIEVCVPKTFLFLFFVVYTIEIARRSFRLHCTFVAFFLFFVLNSTSTGGRHWNNWHRFCPQLLAHNTIIDYR